MNRGKKTSSEEVMETHHRCTKGKEESVEGHKNTSSDN
jgi:hypothetical protein